MEHGQLRYMYRKEFLEAEKAANDYHILQERDLEVRSYKKAVIVPTTEAKRIEGVYFQGNYVPNSGYLSFSGRNITVRDKGYTENNTDYSLGEEEIEEYYPFPVIYLYVKYHYGHFLMDSVSRFWTDLLLDRSLRIAVVVDEKRWPPYLTEFLELMGIDQDRILHVEKNSCFEEVLIPDFSYFQSDYLTSQYKDTYDKVVERVSLDLPVYEKIYFSRVKFAENGIGRAEKGVHREYGERVIEYLFEKNGFKVIYPEELSLKEQMHYVSQCRELVTTNGTIAHNALFARKELELVVLNKFPQLYFGNWHQKAVNDMRKVKFVPIDAYAKGSYRGLSMLILSKTLREYMKDKQYDTGLPIQMVLYELKVYLEFRTRMIWRKMKDRLKR